MKQGSVLCSVAAFCPRIEKALYKREKQYGLNKVIIVPLPQGVTIIIFRNNIKCLQVVAAIICIALSSQLYAQKSKFKVVGYYSLRNASVANLDSVPFDKLTHINLYFLNPDSAGNFPVDLTPLIPFIEAAHKHGVKVLPSIGGGISHPVYHYLLQDSVRDKLISSLLQLVLFYHFDGIDIDLEGDDLDSNYEKFVTGIKKAFRPNGKIVTAAVATFYKSSYTDKALAQFDFMNVMSYDYTGPWDLSNTGPHSTYKEAVADLDYFSVVRKILAGKLVLGVGFYGYTFGPSDTTKSVSVNYGDIVNAFPAAADSDRQLMTNGATVYYNGRLTITRKVLLARKKASGIMIWQIAGDATGDKSLLSLINHVAYDR